MSGEVDLFTGPALCDAVRRALRRSDEVVLDLTQVAFMDCAGLRMLLEALDTARDGDVEVAVLAPTAEEVRRLLELTGTSRLLTPSLACRG